MNKVFNITSNSDKASVIDIFGVIGETWSWFSENDDDITLVNIKRQIDEITSSEIIVNISSLGGDLWEALSIYHVIKSHKANITVNLIGVNASAATVIAMSGDEINMPKSGLFLIHNSSSLAIGNAEELRRAAEELDAHDKQMVVIYKDQTGQPEGNIEALMVEDRWMDSVEAKELGFIDNRVDSLKIAANADLKITAEMLSKLPELPENYKFNNNTITAMAKNKGNDTIESLKIELTDSQNKVKELETDTISAKATEESLTAQITLKDDKITSLGENIAGLNVKLSENGSNTQEIIDAKVELELSEKTSKSLEIRNKSLESQLDGANEALQSSTTALNKLRAETGFSSKTDQNIREGKKTAHETQMIENSKLIKI